MKTRILIVLLLVILVVLSSIACASDGNTATPTTTAPTITTNTPTTTTTTTITPTTTTTVTNVDLPAGVTWITAEEIMVMIKSDENWRDTIRPVDARDTDDWDKARIPSADNIPNIRTTEMAIRGRQNNLKILPRDDLLIFYGYNADGSDSADLVQQFIDLDTGHNPANMRVMELGYDRWTELKYPFSSASG